MAGKKNFADKDPHRREQDPRAAFARRYDDSRTNLFSVALTDVAQNPNNPRYEDDPEVIETAGSLEAVGQLQPIVLVTRDAFVEAYPELDGGPDGVPTGVKYVAVIGNRRVAGARRNKATTLEAVLAPTVATAGEIEDRILHENIHRQQLPPLLEGVLLKNKMDREGLSLRELATAIHKTHTYVDTRIVLQQLNAEFKNLMKREWPLPSSDRTLKVKLAYAIAKLPPTRQAEIWEAGPPFRTDPVIPDNSATVQTGPSTTPTNQTPPVIPDNTQDLADTAGTDTPEDTGPVIPENTQTDEPPAPAAPAKTPAATAQPKPQPATRPRPDPAPETPAGRPASPHHWPLAVEAEDVDSLAAALTAHLSDNERTELAQLLQTTT